MFRSASTLLASDCIVVTLLDQVSVNTILCLRRDLGFKGRLVIYVHGEGTDGAQALSGIVPWLTTEDQFILSCEAERATFKLCFPNARTRVLPLPILTTVGRSGPRRGGSRLVYVGRISEQKNLHTLLYAYWIARQRGVSNLPELEIFGREDGYGSPGMRLRSRELQSQLLGACKRLGLDRAVRWRGFVPAPRLRQLAHGPGTVFVSASLHSDEAFGVAACRALASGGHAVLSRWGGHRDLARRFSGQVRLVPVRGGPRGPYVSAAEFAMALEHAMKRRRDRKPVRLAGLTPESMARELRVVLVKRRVKGAPLRTSALKRRIDARKKQLGLPGRQVFLGYGDGFARPFFQAYGMRGNSRSGRLAPLYLCPWVVPRGTRFNVNDPHRGYFTLVAPAGRKSDVHRPGNDRAIQVSQAALATLAKDGYVESLPIKCGDDCTSRRR
jgi:glycosyltransferase involved in cell wall biosynthesis